MGQVMEFMVIVRDVTYIRPMRAVRRVLGVGALTVLLAACWPMPGAGPDRRSHNPYERTLTESTVGRLTEAFRVPLADGVSPPIVTPAGLFVQTGYSAAAYDPGSGELRWSERLVTETEEGYVAHIEDPIVLGDRVLVTLAYIRQGGGYDHTGFELATGSGTVTQYPANPLNAVRGTRLAGIDLNECCDGYRTTTLTVADRSGGPGWGGRTFETSDGVVTLGDELLFVADGSQVHAYDTTRPCQPIREGEPDVMCGTEWIRPLQGPSTPVVIGDDATVYVGSSYDLLALDTVSGRILFQVAISSQVGQPPALAGGFLHVAAADGRLSTVRAAGCGAALCTPVWTTTPGPATTVQPAVAGGVVYVGSADGTLRAFDAGGCGAPVCEPLWTANAGSPITGGLAVYGGRLYAGTDVGLVAYGLPAG
jgi:outer membrane protein assembly factor BamB